MHNQATAQQTERSLGIQLALEANATKALALINDNENCFEDILPVAAKEIGVDQLVRTILKHDPVWSYNTLRYVEGLTAAHRDALLQRAAQNRSAAVQTMRYVSDLGQHKDLFDAQVNGPNATIGNISGFHIHNAGWYAAEFTMKWTNPGSSTIQPTVDKSDWNWSKVKTLGGNMEEACNFFEVEGTSLVSGAEVWIYLRVIGGKNNDSTLRFTYDPTSSGVAYLVCTGTTTENSIGFIEIKE